MALALGPLPAHGGELIPVLQNPSLDKMRWTMTIALAVWPMAVSMISKYLEF